MDALANLAVLYVAASPVGLLIALALIRGGK